jgi:hypothetical protein
MDRSTFATLLRKAIVGAWNDIIHQYSAERPYAFALIGGQCGNYLGYAFATEEGLARIAAEYDRRGYRYQAEEWEEFDNREQLSIWLRWANPDDGWQYGDFPEHFQVEAALRALVDAGALGEDAGELEEFCTEVLASLQQERAWWPWSGRIVVGFTYGEDPRDYLRTATRANPYALVRKLWAEHCQGEELSLRIPPPP